jgi:mannosyltransferase OCH1-like enzyme
MITKRRKNINKKTKRLHSVPLHIYQVWHDLKEMPTSVKESIQHIKDQNPEFEHHLYDEKKCRKYLEDNFSKRIVNAYDKVVAHALKADLWRYCILYKKGGIYLDSKYYGMNGFKLIELTDKDYFCRDVKIAFSGIYNAFIICKPKNKILLQSIQQFVKNTEENYYGWTGVCIGPLMMKSFFKKKEIQDFELESEIITQKQRYIRLNGNRILKRHQDYASDKYRKDNHWSIHWTNRTLYHYQHKIPSIFFQTGKDKPLSYVVNKIKEKIKGWDYQYFQDKDILQFFKDYPLKEFPNIAEVFHSFERGEHKSDLFRYYFLYVKGGVFMDTDAMIEVDIDTIVKEHDFFSVDSKHIKPHRIFQGFIGCIPKHPIIYEALKDVYTITPKELKEYYILTKRIYTFYQKCKTPDSTLYFEKWFIKPNSTKTNKCSSGTYEEYRLLLTHYPCVSIIPK